MQKTRINIQRSETATCVYVGRMNPCNSSFSSRHTIRSNRHACAFQELLGSEGASAVAASVSSLEVLSVEKRRVRRKPPAPFITSTLQQEASRKLRLGVTQTMRAAQVGQWDVPRGKGKDASEKPAHERRWGLDEFRAYRGNAVLTSKKFQQRVAVPRDSTD